VKFIINHQVCSILFCLFSIGIKYSQQLDIISCFRISNFGYITFNIIVLASIYLSILLFNSFLFKLSKYFFTQSVHFVLKTSISSPKIALINIICGKLGDIEKTSLIAFVIFVSVFNKFSLFVNTLNTHVLNQYTHASFVPWLQISITFIFLVVSI
jgi:hypothetical protein